MVSHLFIGSNFNWQRRAGDSIAQGALTNSKRPEIFVKGVYPTHAVKGQGCYLWDPDGKMYIDYICGLGSNLYGYGNPEIAAAAQQALYDGAVLSLSSPLEVLFAEKLKEHFPFIDLMKILKTGTEACMAAIKIARAHTGRQIVLSDGYHGWSDTFVSLTPPAYGTIPSLSEKFESIHQITKDVAAVIVEPVATDWSETRMSFLRELRAKCSSVGAMLIFDEVITGMRWIRNSVSYQTGIIPDLICLGKALGGGLPLGIVAGKKEVMNSKEYFVSSTFAGDRVAMSAAMKAMDLSLNKYKIDDLWLQGQKFIEGFNSMAMNLRLDAYPTRGVFMGDPLVKALFMQESCKAGILFGPSWFFNFHHPSHTEAVLNTVSDIFNKIKTGSVRLEGELPQTPFAQRQRGN